MQDYRNLRVWQHSHQVVLKVYAITRQFPSDERFGLTSQIRRSAASIPANIAEGSARGSDADFARFLSIAMGSAAELDYHLYLASDLHLIDEVTYQAIHAELESVRRMLTKFRQKLKTKG